MIQIEELIILVLEYKLLFFARIIHINYFFIVELKDKVVLVTGASSGIGKATAIEFAKQGAKVIINYNTNKDGAEETLNAIGKTDGEGIIVKADITDDDEVQEMFEKIVDEYETLDVLISNAGIGGDKVPFWEADKKELLEMFEVNVVGQMLCAKTAASIMKDKLGKILFTSSIKGSELGGGSGVAYASTKAAINNLTKTLAKQLAPNILVNAVAPGYVYVPRYEKFSKETLEKFKEETFLKRFLKPEEIAEAFIFLAKSDAITGQVIYVDAGFTLK